MKLKNVVMPLILANFVVFIFQLLIPKLTDAFMLTSADVYSRPWIILTSMFLHGSIAHIIFNMYVLYIFGTLLEYKIGSSRFLILYFISGIIAAIGFVIFNPLGSAVGASGAIMGVTGALIVLMPNLRVYLFFAIPMPFWVAGILIIAIDALGIIPGVAHAAHLAGIAFGLLYGFYLKKQKTTYTKKFSSKSHMESEDIDEYLKTGRI